MAVSRPLLLALLGAVLVAALFFATMGSRGSTEDSPQASAPAAEQAAGPSGAASKAESRATSPAQGRNQSKPIAPAPAEEKRDQAASAGVPAGVRRALARKRTVVLFFRQRGSADDDATAQAVASLRGRRGVAVFSAPISRLADYRAITDEAGVSQAPAVVVVGRKGRARLIEGFVDRETLAQEVADSR